MKLFIILTIVAWGYAEKLDRNYLPPESASTAGGSPGSLTAPGSQSGPDSSNVPSRFGQPVGAPFSQPSGTISAGQSPSATFSQGPGSSAGQPSGAPFGQTSGPTYGQQPGLSGSQPGSLQLGQSGIGLQSYNQAGVSPQVSGPGFGQGPTGPNQGPIFGGQAQGPSIYSGQQQPERARASIDRNAEILRYENRNDGDTYSYSFETSNGISAEESGVATNGVRAQGAFAYTGDDGQRYSVVYTADENGYQPRGDHLPTPPPIPEEILKSLEDNARAAAAGTQEGAYNPNEDFGVGSGQIIGQPGQIGTGYQPGRGTQGGNAQINYQNQGQTSQYNVPSSSGLAQNLPGSQTSQTSNAPYGSSNTPGSGNNRVIQSGQQSGAQFGTPVSSLSSSTTPGVQGGSPSQGTQPTSQYNTGSPSSPQGSKSSSSPYGNTISSPSVSIVSGNQAFNKDSGYQYNTPLSNPGQFGPQGSTGQNPIAQYNAPGGPSTSGTSQGLSFQNRPSTSSQISSPSGSSGTTRPGFQSQGPLGNTGLAPDASRPNGPTASYGAPGSTTQNVDASGSRLSSQGNQQSGYNYNAPSGTTSPFGSLGSQNYPGLQNNQSPVSQFGSPTKSPGSLNIATTSPSGSQGQPQGQPQYGGPVSAQSNSVRPTDSQRLPIPNNQGSQYGSPSLTTSGVPQSPSLLNQRPQLGTSINSGASGTRFQVPQSQGQDNGYQYNRPQNQFIRPGQTGTAFPGSSGTGPGTSGSSSPLSSSNQGSSGPTQFITTSSPTPGSKSDGSGYNYTPSGPTASGPATSSGPANQGSGPNTSGASNLPAINIGQGYTRPGQYSPSGTSSSSTGTDFSRPGFTSQYQPGQSPSAGSGYQYNRPGSSLGPSSGTPQSTFNPQSNFGSGSPGQNKPGAGGSQPNLGPARQDKPGQPGYGQDRPGQSSSQPGFNPSGQQRPTENFGGPRQPPSFSAEEGYKY